ncbi:UNVERIFIED_CONTAM: hypothetical protein GTU68_055076 [Idotea baltica]|nr:hypothetical protein [Idotea baltica]
MKKFEYLFKILIQDSVINEKHQVIRPSPITLEECHSVHSAEYVTNFFNGLTSEKEQRVTGFKWTTGLVDRVRYETGGTLLAAKLCLDRGLVCSTGGGTHHAFPDHGSGFCLINDMAVTARQMINKKFVSKVFIVDLDVHQGDGTAFIFKDTPEIFTFSVHCRTNFPLRKQKSDFDLEIEPHAGDDQYLSLLEDILPPLLDSFRPDLVLYDAGVDTHQCDLLGKLDMTSEGLYRRDIYVLKTALCRGIPVATVIGGGYDEIHQLSARHTIVHRASTDIWNNYL